MTSRNRLPQDRAGKTHKVRCGTVTLYVTVNMDTSGNPMELFAKADEGYQGQADALCVTASLALQHGCPFATILRKWRGMRYVPDGFGAFSIPDAIARKLMVEYEVSENGGADSACV